MDLAVIAAMDEEVAALRSKLTNAREVTGPFADLEVFQGKLKDLEAVVVRCGIGKVNAALATQYAIDHFNPKLLLTSGVAGGVHPKVHIGDVIVATGAQEHDFDATGFGYSRGVIPRMKQSLWPADQRLVNLAEKVAEEVLGPDRLHRGLVVTGDVFVSSRSQKEEILRFFPEALCADMEAAAIAHVAALNGIPYLILQTISDQADDSAAQAFYQTLEDVMAGLHQVVDRLLEELKAVL